MIEAMLLAPVLRPLMDGGGVLGEYGLDLLAGEIASHDDRGFAALLAARLQRSP
jgi:hypothetical protein